MTGRWYAQPLVMAGVAVSGQGTHDVVFAATEADTVYAFDAHGNNPAGGFLWRTSLLQSGETTIPETDYGTTDITPQVGITGTPVIDAATNTLYVVGSFKESDGTYQQRMYALDITTGKSKLGGPVTIAASGPGTGAGSSGGQVAFSPFRENQRPALTLANGEVYVAWASHGDQGPYHGWLMAYNAATLKQDYVYDADPNGSDSGIWMSGGGIAVNAAGDLYFTTGNGTFDANNGGSDYGMSLEELTPSLGVTGSFTPYDEAALSGKDLDYGCSDVILLSGQTGSDPNQAISLGKWGTIYLNDSDPGKLGGFTANGPNKDLGEADITSNVDASNVHNTISSWDGHVYVGGDALTLQMFSVAGGKLATTPSSASPNVFGFASKVQNGQGTGPTISADGNADGIVWAVDNSLYGSSLPAVLYAYDATNLTKELYSSGTAANGRDTAAPANKYQGRRRRQRVRLRRRGQRHHRVRAAERQRQQADAHGRRRRLAGDRDGQDDDADRRRQGRHRRRRPDLRLGRDHPTRRRVGPDVLRQRHDRRIDDHRHVLPRRHVRLHRHRHRPDVQGDDDQHGERHRRPNARRRDDRPDDRHRRRRGHGAVRRHRRRPVRQRHVHPADVRLDRQGRRGGRQGQRDRPVHGPDHRDRQRYRNRHERGGINHGDGHRHGRHHDRHVRRGEPVRRLQPGRHRGRRQHGGQGRVDRRVRQRPVRHPARHQQTWNGATFAIAPATAAGTTDNVIEGTGQTIALTAGQDADLDLLALRANGSAAALTLTVTYTDGTTQTITQGFSDWFSPQKYSGESVAVAMPYRDTPTGGRDARTFNLYGYSFALNPAKTVKSVTLPKDANLKVLSATAMLASATAATAVNLAGSYNQVGIVADGSKVAKVGSIDGYGNGLSGNLLGTTQTWGGATFAIAPATAGGTTDNVVDGTGQTIALTQGKYATLDLLALHTNGSAAGLTFTVTYTDGTTQAITQGFSDWNTPQGYAGESKAVTMPYRDTTTGGKDAETFYVYGYGLSLNAAKTVARVTLPKDVNFKLLAADLLA